MTKLRFIGTVVAVMAMASPVHASSFVVDDYSVLLNTTDPGLRLYAADVMVDNYAFELNGVGQVHTTGLFRIGTEEVSIERDDQASKPISVSFAFSAPTPFAETAAGTTDGFIELFTTCGLIAGGCGELDWANSSSA
jgi:hypothetical protein